MRTFSVSEVEVGRVSLKPVSLTESLRLRSGATHAAASNVGGLVRSSGNAFLSAVHLAFCHHLPLVLSPDDVWLCLAQGFGVHVLSNAEVLRSRFVSHVGKVTLHAFRVAWPDDWNGVFEEFSDQIALHLGKKRDLVVADFSTTGPIERAASQVVLMSAMQAYFTYEMSFCGIPHILLLGTPEDWQNVRRRAEVLAEFDLKDWVIAVLPVLDQFIAASKGSVDPGFWRSMYKIDDHSGGPFVTGWVNVLFPYLQEVGQLRPNPSLLSWQRQLKSGGGPSTSDFPPGAARAPVKFDFARSSVAGTFLGGFVGVAQDPETLAVRPAIGWAVTTAEQAAQDS
jgi:hypothetical protein